MKAEYDMSKAKRGAIIPSKGKTRVTLYLDDEILNYYRKKAEKMAKGYQTLINEALQISMKNKPLDSVTTLRRVIREELKKHG
jgi:uncharacterized protein (DUF4415 family)